MGHKPSAVFKIFTALEWATFERVGEFVGSVDDARDGFIHLSLQEQVHGTLAKHFIGQLDLVIAEIDSSDLGEALKFEPSLNGQLFPHLYRSLKRAEVKKHYPATTW